MTPSYPPLISLLSSPNTIETNGGTSVCVTATDCARPSVRVSEVDRYDAIQFRTVALSDAARPAAGVRSGPLSVSSEPPTALHVHGCARCGLQLLLISTAFQRAPGLQVDTQLSVRFSGSLTSEVLFLSALIDSWSGPCSWMLHVATLFYPSSPSSLPQILPLLFDL